MSKVKEWNKKSQLKTQEGSFSIAVQNRWNYPKPLGHQTKSSCYE